MFRKLNVYAGPNHPHTAQINWGEGKSTTPQKNARKRRKLKERLAGEIVEEAVTEEATVEISEPTDSQPITDEKPPATDNGTPDEIGDADDGTQTAASSDETKENQN